MGKEVVSVLQGRISRARWTVGQMKSSVQEAEPPVADAKGDQHGNGAALGCVELGSLSSGLEPDSVIL